MAEKQIKRSKRDPSIRYQYRPNNGERCSKCTMYLAPRECTDVAGDITPNGWCRIYKAKRKR
jgi:hypothetical protein